jgi:hypothetical protein
MVIATGEGGWLMLGFTLDAHNIKLFAQASSESLAKRYLHHPYYRHT